VANQNRLDSCLIVCGCIFSGCLVLAAVLASKIISLGPISVPAGVLTYCVTFMITDVVGEIWGKERAQAIVMGGFVTLVVAFAFTSVTIIWPAAPFWPHQEAYRTILGSSARIMVASLAAYLLSQYHDVWAFALWKKITGARYLWLRNNASTIVSQLLDSVVFITIAFYGSMPLKPLIFGQWLIKVLIAILDTPFIYLGVHLLKRLSLANSRGWSS